MNTLFCCRKHPASCSYILHTHTHTPSPPPSPPSYVPVTCRDWFQLTLKEGLTVYRDQEFTSDTNSRPVKRIEDVLRLRLSQFPEDSGPTAHPIRPDEVVKQDNFYTATVYEKGAEVIRMYETILGREGFRKGMDLYFQRHDGCAVTCDDFWQAMRDANIGSAATASSTAESSAALDAAMTSLRVWYTQAGTPEVEVRTSYDAAARTLTLACTQSTVKEPVLIPIAVGILDGATGKDVSPLIVDGKAVHAATAVLHLTTPAASFVFSDVAPGSVPSILRRFSAPVKLSLPCQTRQDLEFLLAHDSDSFNRWESGQRLGKIVLLDMYEQAIAKGGSVEGLSVPPSLTAAFAAILADKALDGSFVARTITLPAETEIEEALCGRGGGEGGGADPVLVHRVRNAAVKSLARGLRAQFEAILAENAAAASGTAAAPFSPDFASVARRAIVNKAQAYVSMLALEDESITPRILHRFKAASNMTDQIAALGALVALPSAPAGSVAAAAATEALAAFADRFKGEPLVLLKWLGIQAGVASVAQVRELMAHSSYSIANPNCNYSLFGAFANGSTEAFHAIDGSGYAFFADIIKQLDAVNPQVAARMASPFTRFKSYDKARAALMVEQMKILAASSLSANVAEIIERTLASAAK
jgi:aminopeptidase N